jgi:hypothetical protein
MTLKLNLNLLLNKLNFQKKKNDLFIDRKNCYLKVQN